jgi:hypothetical protein
VSTPIATPTYTLGSWIGNTVDDHDVEWIVTGEDGWSSSPPIRPSQEDKTAGDGAWAGPGFYGARVVSLTGVALARDRAAMLAAKDRLHAAIGPRAPVPLVVAEAHLTRQAIVRLSDQIDITDKGARAFDWGLTMVAADPRRYAATATVESTLLPASTELGRTYPRTYPWDYGGYTPGMSGSVHLTQAGDYDQTPALIEIHGPVASPRVAHVQTGRSLAFTLTIPAGQHLALDLGAKTALLNGTVSRTGTLAAGSAWFLLTPGANELQFRGTDTGMPSDPDPQMTVTAASAWT